MKPAVLIRVEGGVVVGVSTNVTGLRVRVYNQDELDAGGNHLFDHEPTLVDNGFDLYDEGAEEYEEGGGEDDLSNPYPDDDPDHDTLLNHVARNGPWDDEHDPGDLKEHADFAQDDPPERDDYPGDWE